MSDFILTLNAEAQDKKYTQLWNEIQFAHTFNDKWATEINFSGTFSNTPVNNKILSTNIQRSARLWAHYYLSPRLKLSSFVAFYNNKFVPDIEQIKSKEWRLALQGIYYLHKLNYVLTTRMRAELRLIEAESGYDAVFRYRQQIKILKPINSQFLRQGVFYALATDELFIKSNSRSTGLNFFDRNRFTAGGGYLITDDIQVELVYANEFLPRDKGNEIANALSVTISLNNFLPNLIKKPKQNP